MVKVILSEGSVGNVTNVWGTVTSFYLRLINCGINMTQTESRNPALQCEEGPYAPLAPCLFLFTRFLMFSNINIHRSSDSSVGTATRPKRDRVAV